MNIDKIIKEELLDITNIMSYRPDGFDSGIVNERDDLSKIDHINEIIESIHAKYRVGDYQVVNENDIIVVILNMSDKYPNLVVCFTNLKLASKGRFFRPDEIESQPDEIKTDLKLNNPVVWIYYTTFRYDNEKLKINYNQNNLTHELTHYVDFIKGNKMFLSRSEKVGEYVGNPTEFNAYMIQMLRKYFMENPLNELGEFNEFKTKFFFDNDVNRKIYNQLEINDRRKFMDRLYAFYTKLKERQNSLNENTILNEETDWDLFEMRDEIKYKLFYEFLYENNQDFTKPAKWYYLNENVIRSIWEYYIKYKEVRNFKGLDLIERIMTINTLKISLFSELGGRTQTNPDEDFDDAFDQVITEYLEEGKSYNDNLTNFMSTLIDEDNDIQENLYLIKEKLKEKFWYYFDNGHSSDYGTRPLEILLTQLRQENSPEQKLITIDKMLNVVHQTSDLAENFIRGGSDALSRISDYVIDDGSGWGTTKSVISGKYKLGDYH